MAKQNPEGGIQIGTTSLIVIFVVLALTVFAVLSITSSLADDRLTDRSEEWVVAYYQADAQAEAILKDINHGDFSQVDYDSTTGTANYTIEINDSMNLEVTAVKHGDHFDVTRWQEVKSQEYVIDDSMPVWTGEFDFDF